MSETLSSTTANASAAAVAARVRAARAVLGLSQKELAAEAGISQPALNLLERQQSSPRLNTVEAIEAAFRAHGVEFAVDREGNHTMTLRAELIDALVEKRAEGGTVTSRGAVRRRKKED